MKVKHILVVTSYNNEDDVISLLTDLTEKSLYFEKIFIIDDASSDDFSKLKAILNQSTYSNCEFICSYKNFGGPAVSRNKGLDLAVALGADIVSFIDPDDRLDGNFQKTLSLLVEKYQNVDIFTFIRDTDKRSSKFVSSKDRLVCLKDFKYRNPLILSGLSINLCEYKFTKFSEDQKHIAVEDYLFYLESLITGSQIIQSCRSKIHYGATGNHLSKNKLEMMKKFSRVNIEKFGLFGFPLRLTLYISTNLIRRFLNG